MDTVLLITVGILLEVLIFMVGAYIGVNIAQNESPDKDEAIYKRPDTKLKKALKKERVK